MTDYEFSLANREPRHAERFSHGNRSTAAVTAAPAGIRLKSPRNQFDWAFRDLSPGTYLLGSGSDCNVVLPVDGVAPRHCTIIVGSQRTVVKAWSPRTWVNEGAINEGTLKVGDRLILGPVELQVAELPVVSHAFPPVSDKTLQQLLAAAKKSTANYEFSGTDSLRREAQLNELLSEVQSSLDQLLQQERSTREEFSRERMVLKQRAQELDKQWALLESSRHQPAPVEQAEAAAPELLKNLERQHGDLTQLESLLNDRYEELAGRARDLVGVHRRLKKWDHELRARQVAQANNPDSSQFASVRSMLARNEAQGRQLMARQRDIEQREDQCHLQQEELLANRQKLVDQVQKLEEEQRQWNSKCRSRERFLEELEESLNLRLQQVEEEQVRLEVEDQRLRDQEASAGEQLHTIEQKHRDLDRASRELDAEKSRLTEERTRLERERSELTALRESQAAEQLGLQTKSTEIEELQRTIELRQSELADLEVRLQHRDRDLQARSQELESRQREWSDRQTELQQRLEKLALQETEQQARQQALEARESSLTALERTLQEQSAELERLAAEIESKATSQLLAEEANAELARRTELLAQEHGKLAEEREGLILRLAEIESERRSLAASQEQLQVSLNDITAERQNFARLNAEIEAERQRDAYDREQTQTMRRQLESLQAQLDQQQNQLAEERAKLEQQRAELQFLRAESIQVAPPKEDPSESDAIAEELKQQMQELQTAQANLAEERDIIERRQHNVDAAGDKLKEDLDQLHTLESQLSETQKQLEERERELEESREQLSAERERLRIEREEFEQRQAESQRLQQESIQLHQTVADETVNLEPAEEAAESIAQTDIEPSQPEPSALNAEEDDEAVKLRQQLASLFGMKTSDFTENKPAHNDSPAPPRRRRSVVTERVEADQPERKPEPEPIRPQPPEPVHSQSSSMGHSDDGEVSVEAYMERLLARTRQPHQQSQPESKPVAPAPAPRPVIEAPVKAATEPVPVEEPVKKVRKLDEGAKKSMRANLHSFREVANQSARIAVAKSKHTQKSSLLRNMIILNSFGWATAAALLTSSIWLGKSLQFEGTTVAAVSAILSGLCLFRYKEIRKLRGKVSGAPIQQTGPSVADSPASQPDDPQQKSGPLSFL
ncbi:FHA domain-containing protein [Planctomicrobium sp. SH661]|uniref:FHA domain-containing protein n=1 Tax=Planctomicrobium sp. SH661 TaxID=3448124 RepID=UPI003F5C1151